MTQTLNLVQPQSAFLPMNIEYAASLPLPFARKNMLQNDKGVVVCGTGPTLVTGQSLREIRRLKRLGYKVMAVKQAIRVLTEHEIDVDFSVAMDPGERQIVKTPIQYGVLYFVASSCHPKMFEYLIKNKMQINIFHSACGAATNDMCEMEIYEKYFPKDCEYEDVAKGGYTVVNRAVSLCEYLGAKKIVIAGAPFGWREESSYYAPSVTEPAGNASGPTLDDQAKVDGRRWFTKADLLPSAVSIARKVRGNPSRYDFIGDSLAASLCKKSDAFLERVCPSK